MPALFNKLVLLRLDARQLHLPLAFQRRRRKNRVQQHVRHQLKPHAKIAAQHLRAHAKTVVPAETVQAPAHRFNRPRDFFRRTRLRPLEQHLAIQLRHAVGLGGLRQHAAFEHRAELHERQPMVLLHQQPQAVGQFKFLDRLLPALQSGGCLLRRGAFRQQRVQSCGCPWSDIPARRAANPPASRA